jgi:hypothetical protein
MGGLVATGCLYSQLGHISFTIGGAGLVLGLLCCAFSRQIGLVKHQGEVPICNRLPCRHEGNSCFVNTAMQIMTHLPDYRHLFDNENTKYLTAYYVKVIL